MFRTSTRQSAPGRALLEQKQASAAAGTSAAGWGYAS